MKATSRHGSIGSIVLVAVSLLAITPEVAANTIFESGSLGDTGVSYADVLNSSVSGINTGSGLFQGARFFLPKPATITRVGGHFVSTGVGQTLFAGLVELAHGSDSPDSNDLSSADVLGSTLVTMPSTSAEVFSDLPLSVPSGWYALVFGGGLFGSDGSGVAISNGLDLNSPSYIFWSPNNGSIGWLDLYSDFRNMRYVVEGNLAPEPGSVALAVIAMLAVTRLLAHKSGCFRFLHVDGEAVRRRGVAPAAPLQP